MCKGTVDGWGLRVDELDCPLRAQQFRLLQNRLSRLLLLIRGIAVFAENPADEDADLGLGGFTKRPINGHALANMRDQLPRDDFQRRFGMFAMSR